MFLINADKQWLLNNLDKISMGKWQFKKNYESNR